MNPCIVVAQIGVSLGAVEENLARCVSVMRDASSRGADAVLLPECALSGYVFADSAEARKAAVTLDGPQLGVLAAECAQLGLHCVVGFLESKAKELHNSVALISPAGVVGVYRKAHLPRLGVDLHVAPGSYGSPPVFETAIGRIGLAICHDIRFPEAIRVLALRGADLVALPSNSPVQSKFLYDHFSVVRACENRIFLLVSNRPDSERGVTFLGRSQIVDPGGAILAEATGGEELLVANLEIDAAREKAVAHGRLSETPLFAGRRPQLYGAIVATDATGLGPSAEVA